MFAFKKEYYLLIENIKDIDLNKIKKVNKFNIIYRNKKKNKNVNKLLEFRRVCKSKRIDFYISNDKKLASTVKADGIYISAHNKDLRFTRLQKPKLKIIGSAHNIKEINLKILQGCTKILLSRLFKTSYENKPGHFGVIKYNLTNLLYKSDLIPLGGIRLDNLNKLKIVECNSFAILSEVKKKPAITNRLF